MIDEEGNFPKTTNTTLLNKIIQTHEKHHSFVRARGTTQAFGIQHYAGVVSYSIDAFLEKNRDTFQMDVQLLMQASSKPLISEMFGSKESDAVSSAASAPQSPVMSLRNDEISGADCASPAGTLTRKKQAKFLTIGYQFTVWHMTDRCCTNVKHSLILHHTYTPRRR